MRLKEFVSQESFEAPATIAPQPLLDVNDGAAMALTATATPELDGVLNAHRHTSNELSSMIHSQAALEQYGELLNKCSKSGIDQNAAQFLHVGLEQHRDLLDACAREIPSVESFDGTASKRYATHISLESIKEALQTAGAYIVELLKKLGSLTLSAYRELVLNTDKIGERLNDVKARLSKAGNSEPKQASVEVSNPTPLFIGKQFVGDDVAALNKLVKAVCYTYPKEVEQYIEQLSRHLAGFKGEGHAVDLMLKLSTIQGPGHTLEDNTVYPGNVKVIRVVDNKKGHDEQTFAQGITLVHVPEQAAATYSKTVDEPAVLLKRVAALQELVRTMGMLQTQGANIPTAMNHLAASVERTQKHADAMAASDDNHVKAEAGTIKGVLQDMSALKNLVGAESMKVYSYLHRELSMYTALVKHEADQYA